MTGCGDTENTGASAETSPQDEVVVLLPAGTSGSWASGLDPATNSTGRLNLSMMNAIFGGLFQLTADADGEGFQITGVLASGYDIDEDGRRVIIHLREGVEFSDGAPFDAAAVKAGLERNLTCTCAPPWPWNEQQPVSVIDEHTVALNFVRPYGAVMNLLPATNINWIASPTAFDAMGEEQFRIAPVGAGPFQVVSNQLSSRLVLERNSNYFEDGQPYLDRLVFQSVASEQAGYQALLAGDAHVFEGMTSTPLMELAQDNEGLAVTVQPANAPYVIQLNTTRPPFDDQRAREAVYYATDVDAIREGLFGGAYPASQSFTGPGGLFHHETIPGYRTYDPQRARALVAELGGIEVNLMTTRAYIAEQVIVALQSQWQDAGIDVSIAVPDLGVIVDEFRSGEWQAMLQTAGSYDPEAGAGVSGRFHSGQRYSGVHDPDLDRILDTAVATVDPRARSDLYLEAGEYISDHAYAPFLFASAPAQVAVQGLVGPGISTRIPPLVINTGILWQDVRFEDR